MRISLLVVMVVAVGCKKSEPAVAAPPSPPPAPTSAALKPVEVSRDGALHAVRCGDVTAVWSGDAEMLKDLGGAPKSYAASGLTFILPGGKEHPVTPSGTFEFSDWSFDIFSPDCSRVVLLQDHFGPYTVIATKDLATFANPVVVKADGATASVHSQWRWSGPSTFEFVASCCGGARVLSGDAAGPLTLKTVLDAQSAPSGVRFNGASWEAVKVTP